jgi:hypothetical protein
LRRKTRSTPSKKSRIFGFRRQIERRQNPVRNRPINRSAKLVEARLPLGSCAKPKDFLPDPPMRHDAPISAWAERNHGP